MAIYHLTVNVISRGRGQSIVAAAAYRSGTALRDERYGVTHNYTSRREVVYREIMAPAATPTWVSDREMLWNRVEACEARKDAQLARLAEIGLPIELSGDERVALVRDFVAREFVERGMIADLSIRADARNPLAHILLTLRSVGSVGFGAKERRWNGKAALLGWRSAWATLANLHLARAGFAVRIDHRTLEAQQIELTPARRIGVREARRGDGTLPGHLSERIREQDRIAHQNGETILEDPTVALKALTHQRPVFSQPELEGFLRTRTSDAAQFEAALHAVMNSADCVAVESASGHARFTSRDMIEAETSLARRAASMVDRRGHDVGPQQRQAVVAQFGLTDALRREFDYLVSEGDAKVLAVADDAKALLLAASRQAWIAAGFEVIDPGVRPDAETLTRSTLTRSSVLVIDGAQQLGVKELERVLAVADLARAKAVCLADLDQLESMNVVPPILALLRRIGPAHQR